MGKFLKAVQAIKAIIKKPYLLNLVLEENLHWAEQMSTNAQYSNGLPLIHLNQLFPGFKEELNTVSFLGGGSLPTDIALLKGLCRKFEHCKYFEIGTWRGESAINIAEVAAEIKTLNLSNEEIVVLTGNQRYADLHGYLSKPNKKIEHLTGNSFTYDFSTLGPKDVVFIDGDHHYNAVVNDTAKVFQHLVHEKSIVVWHDYAKDPETVRFEVLKGIIDGMPKEYQGNLYHVANTLCAIYIPEKYSSEKLVSPVEPVKTFKLTLSYN